MKIHVAEDEKPPVNEWVFAVNKAIVKMLTKKEEQ